MAIDLNESGEHEDGAVEETMVEEEILACQFASWFPTCSGSNQGFSWVPPSGSRCFQRDPQVQGCDLQERDPPTLRKFHQIPPG